MGGGWADGPMDGWMQSEATPLRAELAPGPGFQPALTHSQGLRGLGVQGGGCRTAVVSEARKVAVSTSSASMWTDQVTSATRDPSDQVPKAAHPLASDLGQRAAGSAQSQRCLKSPWEGTSSGVRIYTPNPRCCFSRFFGLPENSHRVMALLCAATQYQALDALPCQLLHPGHWPPDCGNQGPSLPIPTS